jgi:hypothetical protein
MEVTLTGHFAPRGRIKGKIRAQHQQKRSTFILFSTKKKKIFFFESRVSFELLTGSSLKRKYDDIFLFFFFSFPSFLHFLS